MRSLLAEPVLLAQATLGEGPAWDHERARLLWVDIPAGALHLFDPSGGEDTVVTLGQPLGAAVPDRSGGFAVAARDGFAHLSEDGCLDLVFDLARPGVRMNDGKCSPDGAFWAGSMACEPVAGAGALYRLEPGWSKVELALEGLTISNGLAWTPDGRRMYFIDTPTRRVDCFDCKPGSAELRSRRPFVEIPSGAGNPDGMTIDDEGCLWVALAGAGRLQRYTPLGIADTVVELPVRQVTSCCFGGDGCDVLFITTGRRGAAPDDRLAGGVFACRPGVTGPPALPYDGVRAARA